MISRFSPENFVSEPLVLTFVLKLVQAGEDSRVDSETLPVSPEISVTYVGEVAGGSERWRERFGSADPKEEIYLAIIKNLPAQNPNH